MDRELNRKAGDDKWCWKYLWWLETRPTRRRSQRAWTDWRALTWAYPASTSSVSQAVLGSGCICKSEAPRAFLRGVLYPTVVYLARFWPSMVGIEIGSQQIQRQLVRGASSPCIINLICHKHIYYYYARLHMLLAHWVWLWSAQTTAMAMPWWRRPFANRSSLHVI